MAITMSVLSFDFQLCHVLLFHVFSLNFSLEFKKKRKEKKRNKILTEFSSTITAVLHFSYITAPFHWKIQIQSLQLGMVLS